MTKKMLIDAAHPEQTRVTIIDGNRVEEFDFESQAKKQIRGNIYLAKVTRVEASLQAAFVDYGGNRHGFLAFNEIHPDYYQIPVEDRQKILAEEAAIAEAEEVELDEECLSNEEADQSAECEDSAEEAKIAEDATKRREKRRRNSYRRYKIQEVIKHGQIMLVQAVKEERGTKGAALTTYMSLAGRYCVLMPNTAKGGGISRKITNVADRKRLKSITSDLEIANGMGLIIRTAGAKRNKTEIKRDYDYLTRLWGTIRQQTLKSIAPALVHEEGGLVRRAVRDLYGKDIESVHVEGEAAYLEAKTFMEMLMPSHANRVKQYKEKYPIFLRYQVEDQLESIHSPEVQLKSGGYLVIHQTEALVAIDVNSGRATKERNIEATALKTNLEAAEESCRQMRLRDLAGLIVIDFIDMDENKNNRAVEKRMKESLKRDRARVQTGRISMFGLFEMSRQRRRASVIEGSSQTCPTCDGIGVVRSIESSALQALQAIESESMRNRANIIKLMAPASVGLYILNEKRAQLAEIETQANMRVIIETDPAMNPPQHAIEIIEMDPSTSTSSDEPSKHKKRRGRKPKATESVEQKPDLPSEEPSTNPDQASKDEPSPSKRRRRGRRGGRSRAKEEATPENPTSERSNDATVKSSEISTESEEEDNRPKRTVRRRRKTTENTPAEKPSEIDQTLQADPEEKPSRARRPRRTKKQADKSISNEDVQKSVDKAEPVTNSEPPTRTKRRVRKRPTQTNQVEAIENSQPSAVVAEKKTTSSTASPSPKSEAVAAKKVRRVVRKRPAKKVDANPKDQTSEQNKAASDKKVVSTPKKATEKKVAVRKPRTRRKPAKNKEETSTPKAEEKPKVTTKAKSNTTSTDQPTATVEPAVTSPVKKTKRSWRSRIFGEDTE